MPGLYIWTKQTFIFCLCGAQGPYLREENSKNTKSGRFSALLMNPKKRKPKHIFILPNHNNPRASAKIIAPAKITAQYPPTALLFWEGISSRLLRNIKHLQHDAEDVLPLLECCGDRTAAIQIMTTSTSKEKMRWFLSSQTRTNPRYEGQKII